MTTEDELRHQIDVLTKELLDSERKVGLLEEELYIYKHRAREVFRTVQELRDAMRVTS